MYNLTIVPIRDWFTRGSALNNGKRDLTLQEARDLSVCLFAKSRHLHQMHTFDLRPARCVPHVATRVILRVPSARLRITLSSLPAGVSCSIDPLARVQFIRMLARDVTTSSKARIMPTKKIQRTIDNIPAVGWLFVGHVSHPEFPSPEHHRCIPTHFFIQQRVSSGINLARRSGLRVKKFL